MAENVNMIFIQENSRILKDNPQIFWKFVYIPYPFNKKQIEIMEFMN